MISIIVGYRNRELERVKNALDALAQQSFTDFELVFIDYGSDESFTQDAKILICKYAFAQYYYSDTRGWFWNRAHALNTGIKLASGDIIIISDIDLIFPSIFLECVNKLSFNNRFYTFSCYYLPDNTDYSNIVIKDLDTSEVNYVGLCAVLKEDIIKNSCFDEYYMNWGGEDDDLYVRLENSGCKKQHMEVDMFPVLHQWHTRHSPNYPTPWYLDMVNYLYSGHPHKKIKDDFGLLIETSKRSVLNRINETNCFKKLELFPNPLFQFNLFLDGFFKMPSGEFGQFESPDQSAKVLPKGRKQKVIDKFNALFSKWNFPYIVEKKNIDVPIHSRESWYEFIMYFIGKNRPYLEDYYIINTDKKLSLFFQKK